MKERIENLKSLISNFIAERPEDIEKFRLKFLSKKGELGQLFDAFKALPNTEKPEFGKLVNNLKQLASEKFEDLAKKFVSDDFEQSDLDISLPADCLD
ncbi:MAG: phenylalanine--tRNA ligase subunit alpha, partial [Bacteroidales bacterium]|nr:phenylalanine--tRNA ligase subunit alpha [Bacteroidales bacterium]